MTVTYGEAIGTLPTPTYTGHVFTGWQVGSDVVDATTVWNFTMDTTAVAEWTSNVYTLTLDADGGTVSPSSLVVAYGVAIGELPIPGRAGYTFDGWKVGADVLTATTVWNYMMDSTAVAQWTANTYTLTLNANGGTVSSNSLSVTYDAAIGTLPTPTQSGYTFTGWQVGSTVVDASTVWNYTVDTTAVAQWTAITYTLTWDANGGTCGTASQSVTYGAAIGELPTPTRTGYTFSGWNLGSVAISATTIWNYAMDSTATAQWTANSYTLTLNGNSGTVTPSSMTVTYGVAIGTLPTPTRSGYTFTGWKIGNDVIDATTVWNTAADATADAQWLAQNYTLNLDANGGTVSQTTMTVSYGAAIGTLPTPVRLGYTFTGWKIGGDDIDALTVWSYTTDSTAVAQWTAGT